MHAELDEVMRRATAKRRSLPERLQFRLKEDLGLVVSVPVSTADTGGDAWTASMPAGGDVFSREIMIDCECAKLLTSERNAEGRVEVFVGQKPLKAATVVLVP